MMTSFRSVLFLTGLTLITASPCFSSHTDITPEEARDLIDSTDTLIILDVREPYEYCDRGHIPGAVNYPWNSGVLEEQYEELINNEILVVCQSGGRSNQAANFLDSKGYTLVYDMLGGMYAWIWETESCDDPEPKYAGGSGTEDDPYQIATVEDLITLGESPEDYDKHFILTDNIDLDPNLPGGQIFESAVIPVFSGMFDGSGFTIGNLTIVGNGSVGFFGSLEALARIEDMVIVDANVTGEGEDIGILAAVNNGFLTNCSDTGCVQGQASDHVGGLIGTNSGYVERCFSSCTVSSIGPYGTAGLVGNNNGFIKESYCEGQISGGMIAGGFVGSNNLGGLIRDCYSTATVITEGSSGGFAGLVKGDIVHCYSTGPASGGGFVGVFKAPVSGSVSQSFWDIETSGQATSAGGTGKATAEMQTENTFTSAGWDFVGETVNGPNDIWWILEGRDYPRLWWQLPTDDFEDGEAGPLWSVYEIEPELAWLEEVNGRLEVNTTGANEDIDAIYAGDGWGLDALKGFSLRVDFHFSKVGIGDGRVNIGVVPSLDPSAMQWAEFEVGAFDEEPFFLYEIRDGDWVEEKVNDRFSDNGTLYFSYNPDKDELYFSSNGYGKDKAMWTVTGLVRGRWQSDSVYVILSGGCDGMALTGEDAWLDNFTVDTGAIVQ